VFSSLFALRLAQETHIIHKVQKSTTRKRIKQQVYTKSRSQLTQKKCITKVTIMSQLQEPKSLQNLHKILQEKVNQKHKKVAHNFEANFSMNLHFTSKHRVPTIMSQKESRKS
jgi:hypothetical protein